MDLGLTLVPKFQHIGWGWFIITIIMRFLSFIYIYLCLIGNTHDGAKHNKRKKVKR